MKRLIYILPAIGFLFFSCNSGENTAVDKDGNTVTSEFGKDYKLPENPCDFLSEEMVTSNYNVTADKLKLKDKNGEGYSRHETCFYTWEKKNFEELTAKRSEVMMSAMMGGRDGKKPASTGDVLKTEDPVNRLGVGRFRKYDNAEAAKTQFINLHRVPTKKDMAKLDEEFKKAADKEGLSEDSKEAGTKLTEGIGSNLSFTEVFGIGDQAFYDHLDKRLDIRFGTLSFSIIISTEDGFDRDMEVAKELAHEVWLKL